MAQRFGITFCREKSLIVEMAESVVASPTSQDKPCAGHALQKTLQFWGWRRGLVILVNGDWWLVKPGDGGWDVVA